MGKTRHPFMDCKSRKRRKRNGNNNKPMYQGYCPRSMVRYEQSVNIPHPIWVCKLCLRCLLTENAVHEHLLTCYIKKNNEIQHTSIFDNPKEKARYTCKYCEKDFSRQVALKNHEKTHEKPKVEDEWEFSDPEPDTQID